MASSWLKVSLSKNGIEDFPRQVLERALRQLQEWPFRAHQVRQASG